MHTNSLCTLNVSHRSPPWCKQTMKSSQASSPPRTSRVGMYSREDQGLGPQSGGVLDDGQQADAVHSPRGVVRCHVQEFLFRNRRGLRCLATRGFFALTDTVFHHVRSKGGFAHSLKLVAKTVFLQAHAPLPHTPMFMHQPRVDLRSHLPHHAHSHHVHSHITQKPHTIEACCYVRVPSPSQHSP